MSRFMPTCARVTELLTRYEEGALGPLDWLGMKLHLTLCPPCQTFQATFDRASALVRQAWEEPSLPVAEQALAGALAALREGRVPTGPRLHPETEAWKALAPGGNPLMALMLRVHLGYCDACRAEHPEAQPIQPGGDPLAALRPHLPPESQWTWVRRGLGGGQFARVQQHAGSGAVLSLARLKGGRCVPRHDHLGPEVSMLLCGGLQDGPAHLRPGDWITQTPGHRHGPAADPGGECLALIHLEEGIRFEGWRGLFGVLR